MDFLKYMLAEQEVKTARMEYNYAGQLLDNAEIKCRLAEMKSQHDPLNKIMQYRGLSERERLYAAAFYVVIGRLPEEMK